VLAVHCFREILTPGSFRYYAEHNHRLERPVEPVGDYVLHSYGTIDDLVSKALGIPLAPD
jgi:hypothetical protein